MKLGSLIKKLHIQNNTMILIREGSSLSRKDVLMRLDAMIRGAGFRNVIMIVAEDLDVAELASIEEVKAWLKGEIRPAPKYRLIKSSKENIRVISDPALSVRPGDGGPNDGHADLEPAPAPADADADAPGHLRG